MTFLPSPSVFGGCALLFATAAAPLLLAAPAPRAADILPPQKRVASVELGAKFARTADPIALPADLKNPFNPAGFDQPDPEELKAKAAAQAAAQATAAEPAKPAGDQEILNIIATRVAPSGTAILGGESILLFRQKKLKVGDHLTITFDSRDYDVEITAIDRTTFSLRLNRAEITRPIKPGKTP